jgi:hypothetical protein
MENYQSGIDMRKYISKGNLNGSGSNYNLGEYRQKYIGNSSAENMYNNLMKFLPRGGHIGKYEALK